MTRKPQALYDSLLTRQHVCQCCGRDDSYVDRPAFWHASWMMHRAHLAAGSGKMLRVHDIRAVLVLCPLCHMLHTHAGTPQVIGGGTFRGISDGNMLWLKRREEAFWDPQYLESIWTGCLPEIVEPAWNERIPTNAEAS